MINLEKIKTMTLGIAVADAVGVPVEFKSREILKRKPIIDMIDFGSHNQPAGTWSDDTSMTIATMENFYLQKIEMYGLIRASYFGDAKPSRVR